MTKNKRSADDCDKPLGANEFSRLLNDLEPGAGIYKPAAVAVAVSGGADSMALTLLLARWAARRNVAFFALTVDHGLRRGSGSEARKVGAALKVLGINHKVLKWQGDKPAANIQALAREARYDLLLNWCRKHKVPDLVLAHHLDDQAETVLLRLVRGSGVDGLAAMSAVRQCGEVRLLRPLLSVASSRLVATCRAHKQDWVEDPSNQNTAFDRIRVRNLLAELEPLGLDARRLAQTARHMARARQTLDEQTDRLLVSALTLNCAGVGELDHEALSETPDELALRLLGRCLMAVGGGTYAPRFERLSRLCENLRNNRQFRRQTLAGCQIECDAGTIRLYRENRNLPVIGIKPGEEMMWDNRFVVALKVSKNVRRSGYSVGPLGAAGWKTVCNSKNGDRIKSRATNIPLSARHALPALWREGALLAQPSLDFRVESVKIGFSVAFSPQNKLKVVSFPVVSVAKDIIY